MKKFAFVFAFLTFCGFGYAQDADTTSTVDQAMTDSMAVVDEEAAMAEAAVADYEAASQAALDARLAAKESKAKIETERDDLIWTWRMWIIIILVLGGVVSGVIGYGGYLNYEATALPVIHHVYPNPVKGGTTNMDLAIPGNTFMAALKVRDREGNEYFSKEIDNTAGKIKVDFSDVPAGTYKLTLEGELGSSPVSELVIAGDAPAKIEA